MGFVATVNVPGYLPMDDDPPVFETAREAWEYLAEERERGEDDASDDGSDGGDPGRFETTLDKLRRFALPGQWSGDSLVTFPDWPVGTDGTGTVYGDTPGSDSPHDLGLAYSVTRAEPWCNHDGPAVHDGVCECGERIASAGD